MIERVVVAAPDGYLYRCLVRGADGAQFVACGHCGNTLAFVDTLRHGVNAISHVSECRYCGARVTEVRFAPEAYPSREDLPLSDRGLAGAIPLAKEWEWDPWAVIGDGPDWAEQNRKINDLLMGRTECAT